MADVPQIPFFGKQDLESLQRYHAKMADFLQSLLNTMSSISFKENMGAVMTEPVAVEVDGGGFFGTLGVEVPCSFEPALVLFKAAKLDSNGRPTGEVRNGCVGWRIGTRSGVDGFTALSGSYLSAARYDVTIIAFPG